MDWEALITAAILTPFFALLIGSGRAKPKKPPAQDARPAAEKVDYRLVDMRGDLPADGERN